jgi:SMC interacting uncharacterized protein involved in chromosome segregation
MNVILTVDHHSNSTIDKSIYTNNPDNTVINYNEDKRTNKEVIIKKLENKIRELEEYNKEQTNRLIANRELNKELNTTFNNYKDTVSKELVNKENERKKIQEIIDYLEDSLNDAGINETNLAYIKNQKEELNKELDNIDLQIQDIISIQKL